MYRRGNRTFDYPLKQTQDRNENNRLGNYEKPEAEVLSPFGCLRTSESVTVTDSHKSPRTINQEY